MLQTLLISSPLLVVFALSLASLFIVLRRYHSQLKRPKQDPNQNTMIFLITGVLGFPTTGSMLLVFFTSSRMPLLILLPVGLLLFSGGELTLRKLVIAGQAHIYSAIITAMGFVLAAFLFPLIISLHEPFTFMYACIIIMSIFVQMALLSSWKKRAVKSRRPE